MSDKSSIHLPQSGHTPASSGHSLGRNAVTLLIVCIGCEIVLSLFFLFGVIAVSPSALSRYTPFGRIMFQPEREVPLYLLGCAGTFFASALATTRTTARMNNRRIIGLLFGTAAGGIAAYLAASTFLFETPFTCVFMTGLIVFAQLIPLWVVLTGPASSEEFSIPSHLLTHAPANPPRRRGGVYVDIVVAAVIGLVLWVPDTHRLAGAFYLLDGLHHWNFFVMSPAIAFAGGGALGADVYSQYGVAWALLFNALSPVFPISYSSMLCAFITLACVYWFLCYVLLRCFGLGRGLAAAATLIAFYIVQFTGFAGNQTIWCFPASTVIRSILDVPIFLLIVAYEKTRRPALWLWLCALIGLAILMETDTGLYLLGAVLVYLAMVWWRDARRGDKAHRGVGWSPLKLFAMGCGVFFAVVGSGLALASQGTLFSFAFWQGWSECLRVYSSGTSLLPIRRDLGSIALLFPIFATYLFLVSRHLQKFRARTSAVRVEPAGQFPDLKDAVGLPLAVYGMLYMVMFIGRSHPANLSHVALPLVVLVAVNLSDFWARGGAPMQRFRFATTTIGAALLCNLISQNIALLEHPGLLHCALVPPRGQGLRKWYGFTGKKDDIVLTRDAHGNPDLILPASRVALSEGFIAAATAVHAAKQRGESVAVLANDDTTVCLAANVAPWYRYTPTLPLLSTLASLDELTTRLARSDAPDTVFLIADQPVFYSERVRKLSKDSYSAQRRVYPPHWPPTDFVRDAIRESLLRSYKPVDRHGIYEEFHRLP